MKGMFVMLISLCCSLVAAAQPPVTLYGFERDHLPGMVTEGSTGTGVQKEYLIYVKTAAAVVPAVIWLNGRSFSAKMVRVKTPVTGSSMVPGNVPVLVAKTTTPVYQLRLIPVKGKSPVSKAISNNAVILQYRWKGKSYTKTLKTLKRLEAVSAE